MCVCVRAGARGRGNARNEHVCEWARAGEQWLRMFVRVCVCVCVYVREVEHTHTHTHAQLSSVTC